jgi:sporulation protein YqfC
MARRKTLERVSDAFDLPGVGGPANLTLSGAHKIHIENHRGILVYDTALISVNCGEKIISIRGASLELRGMNGSEMLIYGDIAAIELS